MKRWMLMLLLTAVGCGSSEPELDIETAMPASESWQDAAVKLESEQTALLEKYKESSARELKLIARLSEMRTRGDLTDEELSVASEIIAKLSKKYGKIDLVADPASRRVVGYSEELEKIDKARLTAYSERLQAARQEKVRNLEVLAAEILRGGDLPVTAATAQIVVFKAALQLYESNIGKYPDKADGLSALREQPDDLDAPDSWAGPYLQLAIPNDPWGKPYQYRYPGIYKEGFPDVWSTGPDMTDDTDDDVFGDDL